VTTTADLDALPDRLRRTERPLGLTYRVSQRLEVVGYFLFGRGRQPDDFPAKRSRHAVGVPGAQVVAMRLDEGRQRAKHCRRVAVNISQRVERSLLAGWPGALASGQLNASVLVLRRAARSTFRQDYFLATVAHNG
jgi:hypothetical protein